MRVEYWMEVMCFNCREDRYNPGGCQDRLDPMPEGAEIQRMEPQVERLVIQAKKVGYLNSDNRWLRKENTELREELEQTNSELDNTRRDLRIVRNNYSDLEGQNRSLKRRIPKKPKKVTTKQR